MVCVCVCVGMWKANWSLASRQVLQIMQASREKMLRFPFGHVFSPLYYCPAVVRTLFCVVLVGVELLTAAVAPPAPPVMFPLPIKKQDGGCLAGCVQRGAPGSCLDSRCSSVLKPSGKSLKCHSSSILFYSTTSFARIPTKVRLHCELIFIFLSFPWAVVCLKPAVRSLGRRWTGLGCLKWNY